MDHRALLAFVSPNLNTQWIRFEDAALRSRFNEYVHNSSTWKSIDSDERVFFNKMRGEYCNDLHIEFLDTEFGTEWVAVCANDAAQRAEGVSRFRDRQIRFIVYQDQFGTNIVLLREDCPKEREYA